jgi:hypothetical protein
MNEEIGINRMVGVLLLTISRRKRTNPEVVRKARMRMEKLNCIVSRHTRRANSASTGNVPGRQSKCPDRYARVGS